MLWVSSGLWRAFAGTEKASAYYWAQPVFWTKMGLLGLILLLELWPMITLIRWRVAEARGTLPPGERLAGTARYMARISMLQLALTVAMVVTASMLARGYTSR
jgi:putative membrane protein